jgi:Arc/MetJ-type ribon-helix-helix transcriptional regulator
MPATRGNAHRHYNSVMRAGPKHHATISVRLSREEERLVRRVARQRKSTLSDVVRDAVNRLAEKDSQKPVRPYEQIADLIGSVADLPADLSERTGERFAQIVREKARNRK